MIRSQWMLKVDETFLVDCCDARKTELESEGHDIVVLGHAEDLPTRDVRHCGRSECINHERFKFEHLLR